MTQFTKIIVKNVCSSLYLFLFLFPFLMKQLYSEWNTRDYMKREHSLLRPYQGKINEGLYYQIIN